MQVGIPHGLKLVLEPRVKLADARLLPRVSDAVESCRDFEADHIKENGMSQAIISICLGIGGWRALKVAS